MTSDVWTCDEQRYESPARKPVGQGRGQVERSREAGLQAGGGPPAPTRCAGRRVLEDGPEFEQVAQDGLVGTYTDAAVRAGVGDPLLVLDGFGGQDTVQVTDGLDVRTQLPNRLREALRVGAAVQEQAQSPPLRSCRLAIDPFLNLGDLVHRQAVVVGDVFH